MAFPAGNLLIDTTPEMRVQLLREQVRRVHAIAFTHHHADHLFGLDDARLFPRWIGGPVPVFCEAQTEECIKRVFAYAFKDATKDWPPGFVPKIQFVRVEPGVPFEVLGQRVLPIRLDHGPFSVLGFRVGSLAYCTDVNRIPEASWTLLENLETLVLDALRIDPHPTHFSLREALEVVERLKPGAPSSRTSHTIWIMLPPRPRCRRTSDWPTMGWPWNSNVQVDTVHGVPGQRSSDEEPPWPTT